MEVDDATEGASLLGSTRTSLSRSHPTYESVAQIEEHVIEEEDEPFASKTCTKLRGLSLSALLLMPSVLLLIGASPLVRSPMDGLPASLQGDEVPLLGEPEPDPVSEMVLAPHVVKSSTTFAELASAMLPAWYNLSVSRLPIFTELVKPGGVYKTRKILLKTRDLLDVFSPVYPNSTTSNNGDVLDQWQAIRDVFNVGYMAVGEFQDLHNAHVLYSEEQLEHYKKPVLEWKRDFELLQQTFDVPAFLANAPTVEGGYRHHESRLFWQMLGLRARGGDPATPWLQYLGRGQLKRALKYLSRVTPFQSVLDEEHHKEYHNLRKELRSVNDEYDLFQWVMFPIKSGTPSVMGDIETARKLLGDMNDDWTAYEIYVQNDEYPYEQERLAERINEEWPNFKRWCVETNFSKNLKYLIKKMDSTVPCCDGES